MQSEVTNPITSAGLQSISQPTALTLLKSGCGSDTACLMLQGLPDRGQHSLTIIARHAVCTQLISINAAVTPALLRCQRPLSSSARMALSSPQRTSRQSKMVHFQHLHPCLLHFACLGDNCMPPLQSAAQKCSFAVRYHPATSDM